MAAQGLRATFVGGRHGPWRVRRMAAVRGEPLQEVDRVAILDRFLASPPADAAWILRGVTSHERYTTRDEQRRLAAREPPPDRPGTSRAALIPISKSPAWWSLSQDERRAIFEEGSAHIRTGLEYLPAVARRLYHGRDAGEAFDFLTWFEYAAEDSDAFEELVARLRSSAEWRFVEREVDMRLERDAEREG